eukprot:COSAG02_NODE_4230_length_5609_cov_6.098911_5_plen_491_part_00
MRRRGIEERRRIAAQLSRPSRSVLAETDVLGASQGYGVSEVSQSRSRLAVRHRCVSPARQISPVRDVALPPRQPHYHQGHFTRDVELVFVTARGETGVAQAPTVHYGKPPNATKWSADVSIHSHAGQTTAREHGADARLRGITRRVRLVDIDELRLLRHRLKAASYGGVPSDDKPGQRPQNLLRQYDHTNRGALSHDEFRKLVRTGGRLGPDQISDATILRIFRAVDTTSSGLVSLRDLIQLVWQDDSTSTYSDTTGGVAAESESLEDNETTEDETDDQSSVNPELDRHLDGDIADSQHEEVQSELVKLRMALSVAERERDEAVAAAATAVALGSRATAHSQKLEKCLISARRDGRTQRSKRVLHSALLAWRLVLVSGSRAAAEARCAASESRFAESDRLQQAHASSVAADLRKAQASAAAAVAAAQSSEQQLTRLEQERAALYADQEGACQAALVSQRQLVAGRSLAVRTISKLPTPTPPCRNWPYLLR